MSRSFKKKPMIFSSYALALGYLAISPLCFAEDGLSLSEAVKTTLELSPARFIQQANMQMAQAATRIAQGDFNVKTSAGVSVGKTYLPLNSVVYNALAGGPFGIGPFANPNITCNSNKVGLGANYCNTFDPTLNGYHPGIYIAGPDALPNGDTQHQYQATDVATAYAGLSKLFESGITASVDVSTSRASQINLSNISRPNANNAIVNLSLNVPLLKGRGETSAAGGLNSARKQQEAAV